MRIPASSGSRSLEEPPAEPDLPPGGKARDGRSSQAFQRRTQARYGKPQHPGGQNGKQDEKQSEECQAMAYALEETEGNTGKGPGKDMGGRPDQRRKDIGDVEAYRGHPQRTRGQRHEGAQGRYEAPDGDALGAMLADEPLAAQQKIRPPGDRP